jgi:hypothetical protein
LREKRLAYIRNKVKLNRGLLEEVNQRGLREKIVTPQAV